MGLAHVLPASLQGYVREVGVLVSGCRVQKALRVLRARGVTTRTLVQGLPLAVARAPERRALPAVPAESCRGGMKNPRSRRRTHRKKGPRVGGAVAHAVGRREETIAQSSMRCRSGSGSMIC